MISKLSSTLFEKSRNYNAILNVATLALFLVGLYYALVASPPDIIQGDSMRIMYIHVPAAWLSLMIYSLLALSCVLWFIFRNPILSLIGQSLAPIGAAFTLIALITGSIWGKPTWGTWWAWDARLTSMLVLMLFYAFYILAFKLLNKEELIVKVSSIIAIIGSINLPIIKYSVEWWATLHQPASIKITGSSSIHTAMLLPLLAMLLVFLLYAALIFLMKYKTEIIRIKKKNIKRL